MARQVSDFLQQNGFARARLTDRQPYQQALTEIHYRPGHSEVAEEISRLMLAGIPMVESYNLRRDIRALPGHIYIPQAIEVSGQVIRLFDPSIHFSVEDEPSEDAGLDLRRSVKHDPRWKKCRRPVVMVGGELTLDMLELRYDASSRFYEAPIQMKAANGVFILETTWVEI